MLSPTGKPPRPRNAHPNSPTLSKSALLSRIWCYFSCLRILFVLFLAISKQGAARESMERMDGNPAPPAGVNINSDREDALACPTTRYSPPQDMNDNVYSSPAQCWNTKIFKVNTYFTNTHSNPFLFLPSSSQTPVPTAVKLMHGYASQLLPSYRTRCQSSVEDVRANGVIPVCDLF